MIISKQVVQVVISLLYSVAVESKNATSSSSIALMSNLDEVYVVNSRYTGDDDSVTPGPDRVAILFNKLIEADPISSIDATGHLSQVCFHARN